MAVHLPSNVVTKEVAVARHHGAGETQPAKGILVVVGSFNDGFDKVGYHKEKNNTFATSKHNVILNGKISRPSFYLCSPKMELFSLTAKAVRSWLMDILLI